MKRAEEAIILQQINRPYSEISKNHLESISTLIKSVESYDKIKIVMGTLKIIKDTNAKNNTITIKIEEVIKN